MSDKIDVEQAVATAKMMLIACHMDPRNRMTVEGLIVALRQQQAEIEELRAQVERMDNALRWLKSELPSLAADAGTEFDYCGEIDAILTARSK